MSLHSIHDLFKAKPRPDFTPSLVPAFKTKFTEMVETYVFTDTIRGYFESILEKVSTGSGQGFWIQAEYGAGKTHFLVTLAALLIYTQDKALWDSVQDESIRLIRKRFGKSRLFPVVFSLRGEGASDEYLGRSLLDVLLEKFQLAIEDAGLAKKIQLTTAQDILNWFETRTSSAIRSEGTEFVHKKTGKTLDGYRNEHGDQALVNVLSQYFQEASINPREISVGVKDRLGYIYDQLAEAGYSGLLVVIDEYEGWQKGHNNPEELSRDAELLETLGFILPRDLGLSVYTIVASQSDVPAKLQGSGSGDRFIRMPLLASSNQRDYDVIIARRTRDLDKDHAPELTDNYRFYSSQFDFARGLSEAEFRDIFPFQPRCFEAVRRITARDLPTARSGLTVFWEVINSAEQSRQTELIRLADMMRSDHLVEECLTKSVYRDSYNVYLAAKESIPQLGLEKEDEPLAHDLLDTLYLWYAAFLDQTKPLSFHDLAEATLTTQSSDGIRSEDRVALVLATHTMPQIQVEGEAAIFKIGSDVTDTLLKFNDYKRKATKDTYQLQRAFTTSLFWKPTETGGAGSGLFADLSLDSETPKRLQSRNIEYGGKVSIASSWRADHGMELREDDSHFRLILLTPSVLSVPQPADLQDARIAVIKPGDLTDEIKQIVAAYEAWRSMNEEFRNQAGKKAEEIRSWLDAQKSRVYGDLISVQMKLYQVGQIITRDSLGISAREAFTQGGTSNDNRFGFIVDRLLTNAYNSLPFDASKLRVLFTSADVGKVFDGYFSRNQKSADINACRNFGIPLGLSHSDKPTNFAPQQVKTFEILEEMLKEQKGDLHVWQIYQNLSRPPYGLPYSVIQLFLLSFVRYRNPRYDLTLKPRHDLQTRTGQTISRDRLTSATVAELAWKLYIQDKFDALIPGVGPSWNDVLAYALLIVNDLHSSHDQTDIEAQTHRLLEALKTLKTDVEALDINLQGLAGTLGEHIPIQAKNCLQTLAGLTSVTVDSYADFHEAAEDTFEHRPEALRDALQTYKRLRDLSSLAADIGHVRAYLSSADLDSSDINLQNMRNNLNSRIRLEDLAEVPENWKALRGEFDQFRERYRTAYQKHHRDYYQAVARLEVTLAMAPSQLQTLEILNQIELGRPAGADLSTRYESLNRELRICPITDINQVQVEYKPVCDQCGLSMQTNPPKNEVTSFLTELGEALAYKASQLAGESMALVVRESKNADLTAVLNAAQVKDLAALSASLSPEVAKKINQGLRKQGIYTFEVSLLSDLAKRFPNIEEADIPRLIDDLEHSLKDAFAIAHKENPGKKSFRLTLK